MRREPSRCSTGSVNSFVHTHEGWQIKWTKVATAQGSGRRWHGKKSSYLWMCERWQDVSLPMRKKENSCSYTDCTSGIPAANQHGFRNSGWLVLIYLCLIIWSKAFPKWHRIVLQSSQHRSRTPIWQKWQTDRNYSLSQSVRNKVPPESVLLEEAACKAKLCFLKQANKQGKKKQKRPQQQKHQNKNCQCVAVCFDCFSDNGTNVNL